MFFTKYPLGRENIKDLLHYLLNANTRLTVPGVMVPILSYLFDRLQEEEDPNSFVLLWSMNKK